MDDAVWRALVSCICAIAIVLTGFTLFDLGSGNASTALWVSVVAWPVVAIVSGWILAKSPRGRHLNAEGEDAEADD